jgi:hypothetical protein
LTDITIGSCIYSIRVYDRARLRARQLQPHQPQRQRLRRRRVGDRVIAARARKSAILRVGNEAIIGAGAVVVGNITSPGTYIGVPARKMHEVKV